MDQHTVLIVEDHRLVRTGLSRLLHEHAGITRSGVDGSQFAGH